MKRIPFIIAASLLCALLVGAGFLLARAISPALSWVYLAAVALVLSYSCWVEPWWLDVTRRTVTVVRDGETSAHEPLRIALITDIHWCGITRRAWMEDVVRRTSQFDPHLVVIAGDFVSYRDRFVPPCLEMIAQLHGRLGVFAVLGNHDHWTGAAPIVEGLARLGVTLLVNDGVRVDHGGLPLLLLGVDDCYLKRDDLSLALSRARARDGADGAVTILLSHSPDIFPEAAQKGLHLVLAGHTHGGQIRMPPLGALVTASDICRRYSAGHYRLESTQLYVSRGLGRALLPFRLACRPELALLTVEVNGEEKVSSSGER